MKASLQFDTDNPKELEDAVGLSLESSDKVKYKYSSEHNFRVEIETNRLGSLRGATDSVFRLVSLSERLR
ncbi:MAG: hypothetical protein R6V35_03465 [Candidatus Nanohaloarchaea archaeon]